MEIAINKGMTVVRPPSKRSATVSLFMYLLLLILPVMALHNQAHAQTSGTSPQLGNSVQGGSAAAPESMLKSIVNYIGNVIMPIVAGLFLVAAVVRFFTGKGWVGPAIACGLCVIIASVMRLIESYASSTS